MPLTKASALDFQVGIQKAMVVKTGEVIFGGAEVGLLIGVGTIENWSNTPGLMFLGHSVEGVEDGVGGAVAGETIPVNLRGDVLQKTAVTGLTGLTEVGASVYATDENTFTLVRPAVDAQVTALIIFNNAGTTADILRLSVGESLVLGLAGGDQRTINLGNLQFSTLFDGDMKTGISLQGHGKIVGFYTITTLPTTDADADAILNLAINGVDLTGGLITLGDTGDATGADVLGAREDSSDITAANEYHDGDLLDLEASGTTAYADGQADVFMIVQNLPGV